MTLVGWVVIENAKSFVSYIYRKELHTILEAKFANGIR